MALISLKCPNCDGEIQLDDNKESGFCLYCGSKLLFKDVSNKHQIELSGKINVEGVATVENLMLRGDEYAAAGDDNKAIEYYNKVLDIDAGNLIARSKISAVLNTINSKKVKSYTIDGLELSQEEYENFQLCINSGAKIAAIKLIREKTGWGLKEAKDFVDNYVAHNGPSKVTNGANNTNYSVPKKTGGCYIATAVYGSYEAPEVLILRKFRDEVLLQSFVGRIFVVTYYAVSPPIANWLKDAKQVNTFVRRILDQFVNKLQK